MRKYLVQIKPFRVSDEVSTKLEVAEYLRRHQGPILFDRVKGYPKFRIAGNLCSRREDIAKILRVKTEEIIGRFAKALDSPKRYRIVDDAEFLNNEVKNPDVIQHLPLLVYYRWKERYYTSATIILARDPETGRENASFHRMMYLGGNRFAIRIVPRDLYSFFQRNKEEGRDTSVVVICGVHPIISLAAATSSPGLNELELASALMDGRLQCVKIEGMDVPVDSEVVMVGRISHGEVAEEGPFVDLTGTWDAVRQEPVVEVERIYMRDEPIWQVILPGGSEHRLLMGLPQEPRMFRLIQNSVPSVKNVVLTKGGCGWLHVVVSIKKRVEGDGKNAGLSALSAHPSLKMVIVVDDDIDITDSESVEWALATRLQPSEGIIVIPHIRGSSLDPSSSKTGLTSKWIVDATIPLNRDRKDFLKAE